MNNIIIPPKKANMRRKYDFSKLTSKGKLFFRCTREKSGIIRTSAWLYAKRNGLKVTSRLQDGGITIYLVEDMNAPAVGTDAAKGT